MINSIKRLVGDRPDVYRDGEKWCLVSGDRAVVLDVSDVDLELWFGDCVIRAGKPILRPPDSAPVLVVPHFAYLVIHPLLSSSRAMMGFSGLNHFVVWLLGDDFLAKYQFPFFGQHKVALSLPVDSVLLWDWVLCASKQDLSLWPDGAGVLMGDGEVICYVRHKTKLWTGSELDALIKQLGGMFSRNHRVTCVGSVSKMIKALSGFKSDSVSFSVVDRRIRLCDGDSCFPDRVRRWRLPRRSLMSWLAGVKCVKAYSVGDGLLFVGEGSDDMDWRSAFLPLDKSRHSDIMTAWLS